MEGPVHAQSGDPVDELPEQWSLNADRGVPQPWQEPCLRMTAGTAEPLRLPMVPGPARVAGSPRMAGRTLALVRTRPALDAARGGRLPRAFDDRLRALLEHHP